jgi:hypothetical protein
MAAEMTSTAFKGLLFFAAVCILMTAWAGEGHAAEIGNVRYSGTCRDFVVDVRAANLTGCWDFKLDLPGELMTAGGWKSTFYYLDNAICEPYNSAVVSVRLDTSERTVNGTAKLRQNSTIIQKSFTVLQDCPQPPGPEVTVLGVVVIGIAVVLGYVLMRRRTRGV